MKARILRSSVMNTTRPPMCYETLIFKFFAHALLALPSWLAWRKMLLNRDVTHELTPFMLDQPRSRVQEYRNFWLTTFVVQTYFLISVHLSMAKT